MDHLTMLKKYLKFLGLGIGLGLIILVIAYQGWFLGIQRNLQNWFYDFDQASSEIIVVAIDENSLDEKALGALTSWPRENYAKAIEILNQNGAATIGIDVTFPNSSTWGEDDDQVLANVLEKYPNVVMASRYFFKDKKKQFEWPNATLAQAQPQLGWINILQDEDGFVRQLPTFSPSENGLIEAFSLAISRIYLNVPPEDYRVTDGQFHFSQNISIPVTTKKDSESGEEVNLMYVNYFAAPNSFRHISFVDLLNGKLEDKNGPIDLRDKIVLIGPTAVDLQDDYLSPVSEGLSMAGVEIHANAIQTLITKEFLRDQSSLSLMLSIVAILVLNLIIFSFLKVRYALLLLIIEVVGLLILGIVAYEFRILVNVVYPILVSFLSFMGSYSLRFILEQNKRKFIEGAFSRYVNKDVMKQIQNDPSMLKLGGAKVDLTVLFSDIAGFTTISENFKPEELVGFLNEYLGEMTDIIMKRQGTLDKYEGDAIMAFWNAPLPQHDHALNACLAALENQKKLAALRKKWSKMNLPEMRVRIGINTGEAVVGNMGSSERFNYTAMGDNVNLASRLEGINKQYGTYLMISQHTHEDVKEEVFCRELDDLRVKGKKTAVKVFELMAKKGEETEEMIHIKHGFEEGLKLYREKKFTDAKEKFEALKNDPPSQVFAKRCEDFIQHPPAADWDGVWNFEVK